MVEDIEEQEDYEVRIGSFNGPMDLLVYLVQKKEMSLDQIPIAEIADDFCKWVDRIGDTDLSKAGDFLYMASRLMALKVQELLPAEERDPELVEEYNADREQLMKEMLEYQRYKQVAGGLQEMEGANFGTYSRGRLEKTQSDEDTLADANIWQLFRAYTKSLKTKISETVHHIELDYVTIQDRQQAINNFLAANGRALFEDLLDNDSHPIVAAVTFMAMLEMIKTDEIVFRQSELFGPIWIYRKKNNAEYADEMARETVFFSKDPEVKQGLVDEVRNMAVARSKQGSVGDIAAVMKEAVLWTSRGRNVTEEDLQAMLEGREDLSEVQDNPFAEMLQDGENAEGANGEVPEAAPGVVSEAVTEAADQAETTDVPVDVPVDAATATDAIGETDNTVDAEAEGAIETNNIVADDETDIGPSAETGSEVEESAPVEATSAALPQDASKQMSDEEFAEFMKKAQAFYSGESATATVTTNAETATSDIPQDSDDQVESKPASSSNDWEDAPISAGNEMTDAEYIAFLNRSAKASRKKESDDDEEGPVVYGAKD